MDPKAMTVLVITVSNKIESRMYSFMSTILLLSILIHASTEGKSVRFAAFGDYGTGSSYEASVAAMVASWNPDLIITTGDNSYWPYSIDRNIGQFYSDYIGDYTGQYGPGADTNRFFPCPGNHDYSDGGGISAYLAYFNLPGTAVTSSNSSGKELYYDFVQGNVHFFSLNSNFQEPDGITEESIQAEWLKQQLSLSTAQWKIIYFHHPPYSSASLHGSDTTLRWPFEDWGATAVLNGHDHTYERIHRDDNADGIVFPYFVTGLGGRSPYSFSANPVEGSQIRYNSNRGAMLIEADDSSIVFNFFAINGGSGTLIDSYAIIDSSAVAVARTEMRPDTLYAFYANAVEPMTGQIFAGDFTDGHTASDVIDSSIRVNASILPGHLIHMDTLTGFQGEVLQIVFPLTEFLADYGTLWDTTFQIYNVSGRFADGTSFEIAGEAMYIGHRSGDLNRDGFVDISDIALLAAYLFSGEPLPISPKGADFDHSGAVDIADLARMVISIYL